MANEVNLEFNGGLVTSVSDSRIQDNELVESQNAITIDGRVRLDRRYILKDEISASDLSPRGIGWGKYGAYEQYVAVVGTSMYQWDSSTTALTRTAVVGATGLNAGDWYFQQFENYMYAGNETSGLTRKLLTPGTDTTGNFGAVQLPTAPASAPPVAQAIPLYLQAVYSTGSLSNSGLSAATYASGRIECTSTTGGLKSVTLTFNSGDKPDWSYRDVFLQFISVNTGSVTSYPTVSITQGGNTYQVISWGTHDYGAYMPFRMQNIARANRNAIVSITYTWTAPSGTSQIYIYPPYAYGVWMSLDTNASPDQPFKELKYEYTFYNSTTGLESPPSPAAVFPASSQNRFGQWVTVTLTQSAESGVTNMRLYRVVDEGGAIVRYRLTETSNSSTSYVDKLPVDEVQASTVFIPAVLPASGITAMCAWQNRLVLFVGSVVYISRDGNPLKFEQLGDAYDPFDQARGLTFYPDDKRSEQGYGLVGQDSLYMVTNYSVRALFGSTPDNWRLMRLPDSEGACGKRAWCPFQDGVLVLTPSGRLLFHRVGASNAVELSRKVREGVGTSGLKSLANSDAVVALRPDGEVEIRSQGQYAILSVQETWRMGIHTHNTHSCIYVSGLPIRWLGTNGKLYEGGDDSYKTDGGTTGLNGTDVIWYVTTKKFRIPRSRVKNVYWGDSTSSVLEGEVYPKISFSGPRGEVVTAKTATRRNTKIKPLAQDWGLQATISGDKDTVVDECKIELVPLSRAKNL